MQTNRKSGENPKFFSSGRITYLINTRLLTRGFYIKNFFEEVIIFFRAPIWRPMKYLVLFSRECSQNSLGHRWCDLFFFELNSHTLFWAYITQFFGINFDKILLYCPKKAILGLGLRINHPRLIWRLHKSSGD